MVIPLVVLTAAYMLISATLWHSIDSEKQIVEQTSGEKMSTFRDVINLHPFILHNNFFMTMKEKGWNVQNEKKIRKMGGVDVIEFLGQGEKGLEADMCVRTRVFEQ